jgi:hypothetical protein
MKRQNGAQCLMSLSNSARNRLRNERDESDVCDNHSRFAILSINIRLIGLRLIGLGIFEPKQMLVFDQNLT